MCDLKRECEDSLGIGKKRVEWGSGREWGLNGRGGLRGTRMREEDMESKEESQIE